MAASIKNGNDSLVPTLWNATNKFIYHCLNHLEHRNPANAERMEQMGITHEDIIQEAYFVLLKALKAYKPNNGYSFFSSLRFATANHFFHLIGMRTKRQRMDPFPSAERFEKTYSDNEDCSLLNVVPDETAIKSFESAADKIVFNELKKELSMALSELDDIEKDIIDAIYYQKTDIKDYSKANHITTGKIYRFQNRAFHKIRKRHGESLLSYAEELEIIERYCYNSSFENFKYTGSSSTEKAAIHLIDRK